MSIPLLTPIVLEESPGYKCKDSFSVFHCVLLFIILIVVSTVFLGAKNDMSEELFL
jgi:hypothetical protein